MRSRFPVCQIIYCLSCLSLFIYGLVSCLLTFVFPHMSSVHLHMLKFLISVCLCFRMSLHVLAFIVHTLIRLLSLFSVFNRFPLITNCLCHCLALEQLDVTVSLLIVSLRVHFIFTPARYQSRPFSPLYLPCVCVQSLLDCLCLITSLSSL